MSPLPVLLAVGDARILQVRHERPVLLVPALVARSMTSDELLRKFAAVRQRREKLRRERAGCHCRWRDDTAYDGPCWKTLRHFDEDHETWVFETERWCETCRRRQKIHEELRDRRTGARRRAARPAGPRLRAPRRAAGAETTAAGTRRQRGRRAVTGRSSDWRPGNTREDELNEDENKSCEECGATEVYRADPRLGDQTLCWKCWSVAIETWRGEMRAAGRCQNCGTVAHPFVLCTECRKRNAASGRTQRARQKIVKANEEARIRQKAVLESGREQGRRILTEWATGIDAPTLMRAFTAANGDYAETLARLHPPWWQIANTIRECRADTNWPRTVLMELGKHLGTTEEMGRVHKGRAKERHRKKRIAKRDGVGTVPWPEAPEGSNR